MPHPIKNRSIKAAQPGACALACAVAAALSGCNTPPRPDADPTQAIASAAGLAAPVEFRAAGPDGGPLDEPDTAGATLTLAEAVRRAVTTDPSLQAAMARVRIAAADADQARLLPNPVLNVVLRWGPGKPQIEASFAQEFVQALQLPLRASAADNRLRQVAAEAVTDALDIVTQVQERYAEVQASSALVPLLRQRLSLLEKLCATTKARLDAGEGTRADVATLNAQRVELLVEIDGTLLAEREERLRLARLIGEPSSSAAWVLDTWASPSIGNQPEALWIEAALHHRPEVQAILWRMRALGDDEALVRLMPWEGASLGVDASRDDKWFAGPSISTPLPVLDSGQAARERVTAEQLEARHDLTLARRKVVEEVRVAFATLAASKANLARIQGELIPLQQQRRQLAEDAYKAGQTDVTALFLAEQDLRIAEARSIEVERQAAGALLHLQRAVGGPGVAASAVGHAPPGEPPAQARSSTQANP